VSDKSRGSVVDREQLLNDLLAADPQPGELVYVARRGGDYCWDRADEGASLGDDDGADAWIFYSWQRTLGNPETARAMFSDLLDEMESMTGCTGDRCRWPLDEPWPRAH